MRGVYFYLYLFVDLFSRKIVGWQVYDSESAERAGQLLTDICARQGIAPQQLTLHSDNGSPMKGEAMLATLQRLGVAGSRSRPAVSNDNRNSPTSTHRVGNYSVELSRSLTSSTLKVAGSNEPPIHFFKSRCSGCLGSANAARSSS